MTTPRITQALEIVNEILEALAAADLPKVMASLDAATVASGARHGVVIVSPPRLTFPTFDQVEAVWEVHVIAGPADNYLAAWQTIDTITQALLEAQLPLNSGEPGQFQPIAGPPLWAYTFTLATSN